MGEGGASVSGPVGVHPQRSVLFAQVSDSDPRMAFDEGGTMHQFGTKGSFGKVYLGDVSRAALRSLGTHSPPRFTDFQGLCLLCLRGVQHSGLPSERAKS